MDLYIITKSLSYHVYLLHQMFYQKMLEIIGQFKIRYSQP